jgi:hypothetical protein
MLAIAEKLNRLEELQAQREALDGEKQALMDEILGPELRARLAEVEAEFAQKREAVDGNIAALEAEIKADVLAHGETVRGARFQAVWNKGRESWDSKGLSAYAESNPDVLQFRKQGDPSVTIRRVGGGDRG